MRIEEIFFDRCCPQLFRQVLEYLRNKKVYLPIMVSKTAVLSELEYYCVDDVEEEAIDDGLTRSIQLVQSMKDFATHIKYFDAEISRLTNERDHLKNEMEHHQISMHTVEAAKALLKRFLSDPTNESAISLKNVIKKCHLTDSMLIKCNEYLARVGLKIERNDPDDPDSDYIDLSELKPL
jgi:hypothetical protein